MPRFSERTDEFRQDEKAGEDMAEEKRGFFRRLVQGLSRTRKNIGNGLSSIFGLPYIDEDFYEELEETLIMSDMGVRTTVEILDHLREEVDKRHLKKPSECRELLIESIREQMHTEPGDYRFTEVPSVVLFVGVNGSGKTTTIGKLALKLKKQGKSVVLAAADTFRAAAADQLKIWADRSGVEMIRGQEGQDPASVVYDAIAAWRSRRADILLVDTAGRLHNKKNLMNELGKIYRVLERETPGICMETLLVLDGATGQNALMQAESFAEAAPLTGIVLTKLDGTSKGGIAVAIQSEMKIPVKYIGVGESIDDLERFDPDEYVDALFQTTDKEEEESSS